MSKCNTAHNYNRVINPNEYLSNIPTNILEQIPEKYREYFRKGTIPTALAQKIIDSIKSNAVRRERESDESSTNTFLDIKKDE